MMKSIIVLLLLSLTAAYAAKKPLHFTFIAPYENELTSTDTIIAPAVDSALQRINSEDAILPQYHLKHSGVQHSMCDRRSSLDVFFREIPPEPVDVAVLGGMCSQATEVVAEIVHYWNISLVSYAPWAADDSVNHFRMYPPIENLARGVSSLLHQYRWKRISIITEEEESERFLQVEEALTTELADQNISVITATQIERNTPLTDLDYGSDIRIFFLNVHPKTARKLMCKAYRDGIHYPRYVWITYGWYDDDWYREQPTGELVEDGSGQCTVQELTEAINGALIIQHYPTASDTNAPTMSGITPKEFHLSIQEHTFLSTLAYDAVWVVALALNETMNMVNRGDINGTGCEGLDGDLVDLEHFSYSNAKMGCLIRYSLVNTDFQGISGQVQFNQNGSRHQSALKILRYRNSRDGHLDRVNIASVNISSDFEFSYARHKSDATVFPGGIPPDGTPLKAINVQPLWLLIPYYMLSAFGIVFATICLLFNLIFRKRRIVRLTSPNLNYFIIAGAIVLYISIYFRLFPNPSKTYQHIRCNLQAILCCVGYVLCFAPVLVKMWRVYYIFHNPSPNKKAVKDWHLAAAVLVIVGTIALMTILSVAVPQLRPDLVLKPDKERPQGKTDDGVTIIKCAWDCYDKAPPVIWISLEFVYMVLLQVVAVILAFKTRKVKIKALNDSKSVTAIIYTTSIVLSVLAISTFALDSLLSIVASEIIFSGGIILATTVFVCFIFIPKMLGLHRDPKGQTIFEPSGSTVESGGIGSSKSEDTCTQTTILSLTVKIKELETELSNYKLKLLPAETTNKESSNTVREPLDQQSSGEEAHKIDYYKQ